MVWLLFSPTFLAVTGNLRFRPGYLEPFFASDFVLYPGAELEVELGDTAAFQTHQMACLRRGFHLIVMVRLIETELIDKAKLLQPFECTIDR